MDTIGSLNVFSNLREKLRGTHLQATRLVADSMDLGWEGVQAAITRHGPLPGAVRGIADPSLIGLTYHLAGPTKLTRKIDGGPRNTGLVLPRQLCLTPAGEAAYWNHSDRPEILR